MKFLIIDPQSSDLADKYDLKDPNNYMVCLVI